MRYFTLIIHGYADALTCGQHDESELEDMKRNNRWKWHSFGGVPSCILFRPEPPDSSWLWIPLREKHKEP